MQRQMRVSSGGSASFDTINDSLLTRLGRTASAGQVSDLGVKVARPAGLGTARDEPGESRRSPMPGGALGRLHAEVLRPGRLSRLAKRRRRRHAQDFASMTCVKRKLLPSGS